jgi:hypothetical protein
MTCKQHPKYQGIKLPKDCDVCYEIYRDKHKRSTKQDVIVIIAEVENKIQIVGLFESDIEDRILIKECKYWAEKLNTKSCYWQEWNVSKFD